MDLGEAVLDDRGAEQLSGQTSDLLAGSSSNTVSHQRHVAFAGGKQDEIAGKGYVALGQHSSDLVGPS